MKKLLLVLAVVTGISTAAFSQYYYVPFMNIGQNPGNLNNDAEQPAVTGWTSIQATSATPVWSPVATIPFTFTFNGNSYTSLKASTSGVVTLKNSTFNPNAAFVSIVASDNFAVASPSNTNYMLQVTGKANSVTRVVFDSFGQNTYPLLAGRMGRGSAATPAAVAAC